MTTIADLRERVYTVVRDSSRDFVTEDQVDIWLTEAMNDLSSRLHLAQNSVTGTTSGSTIALPNDYGDLLWLKLTSVNHDPYVQWPDQDVFNNYVESEANTSVTLGRVFNNSIELIPVPADGTAYELRYWSNSQDLDDFTGALEVRAVNYARAHAKYKEGEMSAGDNYMAMYERNLPSPSDAGKNRQPGPISIYPVPGPFEQADYLN